jgi:hypothetical protein
MQTDGENNARQRLVSVARLAAADALGSRQNLPLIKEKPPSSPEWRPVFHLPVKNALQAFRR